MEHFQGRVSGRLCLERPETQCWLTPDSPVSRTMAFCLKRDVFCSCAAFQWDTYDPNQACPPWEQILNLRQALGHGPRGPAWIQGLGLGRWPDLDPRAWSWDPALVPAARAQALGPSQAGSNGPRAGSMPWAPRLGPTVPTLGLFVEVPVEVPVGVPVEVPFEVPVEVPVEVFLENASDETSFLIHRTALPSALP